MSRIDAHLHFPIGHASAISTLKELDLRLLNICVSHRPDWQRQREAYRTLHRKHPEHYDWCTSFDMPGESDFADHKTYAERVIAGLREDIADGTVACKIWKNVGMEIKKPDGRFLMPDDPIFNPILEFLAAENLTLLCHIAEPLACWRPLVDDNPHHGYYSNHPEWHMYGKTEYPSHRELIDARDRMVAAHPGLRVVGAHFGSLEFDVREVAGRLDQYPNFAVDTSARMADLTYQDVETVRAFFRDYRDRILWGTDIVIGDLNAGDSPDEDAIRSRVASSRERWRHEFEYYSSEGDMEVRGRTVPALDLPGDVLEDICTTNAERWYPGLARP